MAALFVSLMSVRVPHRPEKHEYNKMKMKDTCAGWQRVWGGSCCVGRVDVSLQHPAPNAASSFWQRFAYLSGGGRQNSGRGEKGGRSSSGSWLRDDGVSFK